MYSSGESLWSERQVLVRGMDSKSADLEKTHFFMICWVSNRM